MLALGLGLFGGGCSRSGESQARSESISVPRAAIQYATDVQPLVAIGGPGAAQLQADVAATLAARGDQAAADGALGAVASWALEEVIEGRKVDAAAAEWAFRHFGFGGEFISFATFEMRSRWSWQNQLSRRAGDLHITRYGLRVSPSGKLGTVVFGRLELDHEPIPRMLQPGQSIAVKGQVSPRFSFCHLYLAKPDGTIDERVLSERAFDVVYNLSSRGEYQLEVMGDGKTGPEIAANLPLYVGVPEPKITPVADVAMSPEQTKVRLLELANQARRAAGHGLLQPDAELDELALSHSVDMAQENFFGHVSPTTGTLEDRVKRTGLRVSLLGENLSRADSPELAQASLFASPGHRAVMLNPNFTHVGIGVTPTDDRLAITMEFGRRPSPEALPTNAAQIEATILRQRASLGLPIAKVDALYHVAAQAGAEALAKGAEASAVGTAVQSTLQRDVDRLQTSRGPTCILRAELLELTQLDLVPMLKLPALRRFGVGARSQRNAKNEPSMATVFVLEGVPCE
jgi:hypothetical protein